MSINLIDLFRDTVSEVIVRQTTTLLDESSESVSSAVHKIFPALLNAIIIKGSTDQGANDLLQFISNNHVDDTVHENLPSLLSGDPDTEKFTSGGSTILKYLLGDKLHYLVDWVSSGNGLKTSSASTLLKIIAPLAMGAIARAVKERSLKAAGLKDLLLSQQPFVDANAPAAITELLGVAPVETQHKTASGTLPDSGPSISEPEKSTLSKLLPWIVLLIAALGLFYFLDRGSKEPEKDPAQVEAERQDSIKRAQAAADSIAALSSPVKKFILPGDWKIDLDSTTFSGQLASYLGRTEPAGKCFAFDKVSFESGSANITAESMKQLNELKTIMFAYATMEIRIEGHTDTEGDDAANLALSKERAEAVKQWLVAKGIAEKQIKTMGLGETKPIASNDDETGRLQNRRVEVCVVKR